jgi:hypothetical protein
MSLGPLGWFFTPSTDRLGRFKIAAVAQSGPAPLEDRPTSQFATYRISRRWRIREHALGIRSLDRGGELTT